MLRVAALLAAGSGSRFLGNDHKLLADLGGQPVWHHALRHVMAAGFDRVLLVTGAVDLALPADIDRQHVVARHNPHWSEGQARSVQLAVAAAAEWGADAITIGLADQPYVSPQAWRAVAEAPAGCRIVIATYGGEAGPNPVRLAADVWPLLPTSGDAGARTIIREHPQWVCRVACVGSGTDIDTLEDLARWNHC